MPNSPADVLAIYRLPSSITFEGSCLGVRAKIRLAGLDGEVWLPAAGWRERRPLIVHPPMEDAPSEFQKRVLATSGKDVSQDRWGLAYAWRDEPHEIIAATIQTIVLHFSNVDRDEIQVGDGIGGDAAPAGPLLKALLAQIEPWFQAVSAWIRVMIDQDLDPSASANAVKIHGEGLEVLAFAGDEVLTPRISTRISIANAPEDNVDLALWNHVLGLVNNDIEPPIEHALASSARAAFRSGQFRRAVVDSGTAAELALTHLFESGVATLPQSLRDAIIRERRTLGRLLHVVKDWVPLPEGLESDLVSLRNRVIHRNYLPSPAEARKAANLAVKLAETARPLPQP
jgi:hypothetical protein